MQSDTVVLGVVNHKAEYTFWAPNCLLGADGSSSTVARTLRRAYPGEGFEMRKCPSDSAGLAFKVRPDPSMLLNWQLTTVFTCVVALATALRLVHLYCYEAVHCHTSQFSGCHLAPDWSPLGSSISIDGSLNIG